MGRSMARHTDSGSVPIIPDAPPAATHRRAHLHPVLGDETEAYAGEIQKLLAGLVELRDLLEANGGRAHFIYEAVDAALRSKRLGALRDAVDAWNDLPESLRWHLLGIQHS